MLWIGLGDHISETYHYLDPQKRLGRPAVFQLEFNEFDHHLTVTIRNQFHTIMLTQAYGGKATAILTNAFTRAEEEISVNAGLLLKAVRKAMGQRYACMPFKYQMI